MIFLSGVANLCDTFHHVLNVWTDSLNSSQLFPSTKPLLNQQLILANLLYVDTHVPEVPPQSTARTSHNYLPRLDWNFNCNAAIRSQTLSHAASNRDYLYHNRLNVPIQAISIIRYGPPSFAVAGPSTWNSLQAPICSCHLTSAFHRDLKTELFTRAYH